MVEAVRYRRHQLHGGLGSQPYWIRANYIAEQYYFGQIYLPQSQLLASCWNNHLPLFHSQDHGATVFLRRRRDVEGIASLETAAPVAIVNAPQTRLPGSALLYWHPVQGPRNLLTQLNWVVNVKAALSILKVHS